MKKVLIALFMVLVPIIMIGCKGDNEKEQLKKEIQRLNISLQDCRAEKENIMNEKALITSELKEKKDTNIKLQKNLAATEIKATSMTSIAILISIGLILINNLIWIIVYRRKK